MTQSRNPARLTARRTVVAAVGAGGLTAALAACGDDSGDSGGAEDGATGSPGESGGAEDAPQEGGGDDGDDGAQLGSTDEVPEGGGKIFKDQKVVVTQPEPGEFKAFSAVCTHQGCIVSSVEDGSINCSCHGSKFAIADGSVEKGPATQPLPAEDVQVDGDVLRQG